MENIIIVESIPRPKEPKVHINTYLKPFVDELLDLWNGKMLKTSSLFGVIPVSCALTCISCDLPATRKLCGFLSCSASHGCSKCQKHFPCIQFGEKLDYSGYERDEWLPRTQHICNMFLKFSLFKQLLGRMNLKNCREHDTVSFCDFHISTLLNTMLLIPCIICC